MKTPNGSKIIFAHLFNNYSGSPSVLRSVVIACRNTGLQCKLLIGNKGGILDDLPVEKHSFNYRYYTNKTLTLINYIFTQLWMFMKLVVLASKNDTVYINTMLPFGAAMAAKLKNCYIIYHIHEINVRPALMKLFLRWIIELTANQVIFVSQTLYDIEHFHKPKQEVIYNALSSEFEVKARLNKLNYSNQRFNVLMICSPKTYKGVFEFVKLAVACRMQTNLHFTLVLGAEPCEVYEFLYDIEIPLNMTVHSKCDDVFRHYFNSQLVLNLSRPDQCVETFGLTVLEAMACGLPVIVPPVGGPRELVEDGIQGFHVDPRNTIQLQEKVLTLSKDYGLYVKMSIACRKRAAQFSYDIFAEKILATIYQVRHSHA